MSKFEQMQSYFNTLIEKYGWASHYVPLDENHINYHTHGLMENYNHCDLQITLPVSMEVAHGIISKMVDDIKNGLKFYEGIKYTGYIKQGYDVKFMLFKECERPVLRVLLPDSKKVMPDQSGCEEIFKYQLDELND